MQTYHGICGGVRRRSLLAQRLRRLRIGRIHVRNFRTAAQRPCQREKGGAPSGRRPGGQGYPLLHRQRLRLSFRRPDARITGDKPYPAHLPYLRIRHGELPVLRPIAAQHLREGHQKRYEHLRFRKVLRRLFAHDIPAFPVVRLLGADSHTEHLPPDRVQEQRQTELPRSGRERGGDARMAGTTGTAQAAEPPRTASRHRTAVPRLHRDARQTGRHAGEYLPLHAATNCATCPSPASTGPTAGGYRS